MARPIDPDDLGPLGDPDEPEVTARPSARSARALGDEDQERLVPGGNVGGAAPTPLGLDSGGDLPGPEDDLANLAEPEPPAAPELEGLSVPEEDLPRQAGVDEGE